MLPSTLKFVQFLLEKRIHHPTSSKSVNQHNLTHCSSKQNIALQNKLYNAQSMSSLQRYLTRRLCTKRPIYIPAATLDLPEEPSTCCMSGCQNCVWLDYAEKLTEFYKDGGDKSVKEINERISDPNIKAYLLHELRMRNQK